MIADVPPSTATLVVGSALVCLTVGAVQVRPGSLPGRAAPVVWWLLALASAPALVWNALYSAALSEETFGAIIPIFHWLFAFVPAFVVGLVSRSAGSPAQLRATLGTAVVTLPLFALGWALLTPSPDPVGFLGALYGTGVLGVLPLGLAVALTWTRR